MSNQFDALLDFGDDPPPSSNGTAQNANCSDEFDPFGASPFADSGKAGSGDGGLLLDFSVTTEVNSTVENGTASGDPFDSQFTINSSSDFLTNDTTATTTNDSSSNPFSDMSTTETQPSANPLYDLMGDDSFGQQQEVPDSSSSANPLYDMSTTDSEITFETNTTTTTTTTQDDSNTSANPLYDFMGSEGGEVEVTATTTKTESSAMDDFLGLDIGSGSGGGGGGDNGVMEKSTPCGDIMVEANDNYIDNGDAGGDQVVPDVALQQEAGPRETTPEQEEEEAGFDQNVELFIREDDEGQVEDGRVAADVEEEDVEVAAELDVDEKQELQVEEEQEPERPPEPEPEPDPEPLQQQQEEEEEVLEEVEAVEVMEEAEEDRPCSRHSISSEGEVLNEDRMN